MQALINTFLPNSIFTYKQHNNQLFFKEAKLRPFCKSIILHGKDIFSTIYSNASNQKKDYVFIKTLRLYTRNKTRIVFENIRIQISDTISIRVGEIIGQIGSFTFTMEQAQLNITEKQLHVKTIRIGTYITISRFDSSSPHIHIQWGEKITISIPEIRIHSTPSIQLFQSWKASIDKWVPKEKSDDPLPEIHISSIFIRFVQFRNMVKTIRPISIGTQHQSIWELWVHIIHALIGIE